MTPAGCPAWWRPAGHNQAPGKEEDTVRHFRTALWVLLNAAIVSAGAVTFVMAANAANPLGG